MMGADADPSGSPDDRDFAAPADAPARAASGAAREVQASRAAWADERGRAREAEARASGSDEPEARADGRSRGDRARTYDSFDDTSGARTSKETTPAADRDPSPAAPFSRARDATHGAVEEGEGFTVRELPNPSARAASERSSERVPAPDENRDADDDAEDDEPDAPVAPSSGKAGPRARLRAASEITQEDLSSCFHLPSEAACRKLGIGLTVLKRQCRKFGIKRWPFRKMKSLDRLITNVQAGISPGDQNRTLVKSVEELEEQKARMQDCEELDLDEDTKKLQQAYSKANHKARRMAAEGANAQDNRLFSDLGGLLALGSPAAAGGGADAAAAGRRRRRGDQRRGGQPGARRREGERGTHTRRRGRRRRRPGAHQNPLGGAVPSAPRIPSPPPSPPPPPSPARAGRARRTTAPARVRVARQPRDEEKRQHRRAQPRDVPQDRRHARRRGRGRGRRRRRARRDLAAGGRRRALGAPLGARGNPASEREPPRGIHQPGDEPRPRPRSSPPPSARAPEQLFDGRGGGGGGGGGGAPARGRRAGRVVARAAGAGARAPAGAGTAAGDDDELVLDALDDARRKKRKQTNADEGEGARARTRRGLAAAALASGGEAAGGGEAEEGAEGGAGGGGGAGGRRRHSRRRTRRWSR